MFLIIIICWFHEPLCMVCCDAALTSTIQIIIDCLFADFSFFIILQLPLNCVSVPDR